MANVVVEATGAAISSATLLGYQAEGARTNLCLQSQTFDTTWSVTSITITADSVAAPDGTTTADRVNITAGTTAKYILQGGLTVTNPNTFSVYAKKGTWDLVQLAENISANRYVNFDLTNGVVGSSGAGVTRSSITSIGNGWYRLEAVFANSDATSVIVGVISSTTDAWAPGLSISTTGNFYLWGAQLENATFASSYIPTTTVAVTRNRDALSYTTASNFDRTTGTMYVEAQLASVAGTSIILALPISSYFFLANSATTVQASDATNSVSSGTLSVLTGVRKMALAWGGVTMLMSKDGAAASSTAFTGAFEVSTDFVFGRAAQEANGNMRNLVIYGSKKTAAELATLTT